MAVLKPGLKRELALLMKEEPYYRSIELLSNYPIKLSLRFSEQLFANLIISDENSAAAEYLNNLKHIQVISGYNSDLSDIKNKFVSLQKRDLFG